MFDCRRIIQLLALTDDDGHHAEIIPEELYNAGELYHHIGGPTCIQVILSCQLCLADRGVGGELTV